jgi:integrase/recombinase XerD
MFPTATGTKVSRRNMIRDSGIFCEHLGIHDARPSPHTFRHYFAISYLQRGGDIYALTRILGHTSVKVTDVYLRSMGIEDFQAEQQRLSPVSPFLKKLMNRLVQDKSQ